MRADGLLTRTSQHSAIRAAATDTKQTAASSESLPNSLNRAAENVDSVRPASGRILAAELLAIVCVLDWSEVAGRLRVREDQQDFGRGAIMQVNPYQNSPQPYGYNDPPPSTGMRPTSLTDFLKF